MTNPRRPEDDRLSLAAWLAIQNNMNAVTAFYAEGDTLGLESANSVLQEDDTSKIILE